MSFVQFMLQFTGPCVLGMFVGFNVHELCHLIPLRLAGSDAEMIRPSIQNKRLTMAVCFDTDTASREVVRTAAVMPLAVALVMASVFVSVQGWTYGVGVIGFVSGLIVLTGKLSYMDRKVFREA